MTTKIGSGVELRQEPTERPNFDKWNLATPTAGLRLFQTIGSIASLVLIVSVGSQFSPTYGALLSCTLASICSTALVIVFSFNIQRTTPGIDWIFWEIIYTASLGFLFVVNTITMTYSSIRWTHAAWYLSAVICMLVAGAFIMDTFITVRLLLRKSHAKHSQDSDYAPVPQLSN